jgi:glycosyltransferase involved in cell wall biosynthesis
MLVSELVERRGRRRKLAWIRWVERRTLARASALHVTTELEAREAERFDLPLPPVRVVPNGIDLASLEEGGAGAASAEVRELVAGTPYFLALGRINWKKGLDRPILALAALPGARLVVAGPDEGSHRLELEGLARQTGTADRVRFLGPVAGADKVTLLRGARALVLTSASENFANAVLESMAAGRPVVVTPEVGLAQVVREADCGLVVPGDPESLEAALRRLLDDPGLAEAMGRRGRAAATAFAWPEVARRMEAVYREILGEGAAG